MTDKISDKPEPFAAYEKAFDSENRRSKTLSMIFVLMFITAVFYAFTVTIHHLGTLNAYVPGVFEISDEENPKPVGKKKAEYPKLDQ